MLCVKQRRELLHKTLSRYCRAEDKSSVMLVEDDEETRKVIAHNLEKSGWVISTAENGRKALALMSSFHPALILLDLKADGG